MMHPRTVLTPLVVGLALMLALCQVEKVQAQATSLCRLGLNVFRARVGNFDLQPLRLGWYLDQWAWDSDTRPNGIEYFPLIQLAQVGADGFRYAPNGAALDAAIAAHPGANWIIGNEPDRRHYQNDLLPEVYAHAYHDVRAYILSRDPTARLLAGTIVQSSPLRLQYLDLVLAAYQDAYSAPLPADGWSLHNFILNERSCEAFPDSCWGAEIPPGIDADEGMVISDLDDHINMDIFIQQIERFRRWMAENGYRNSPLYLTEYGVLLPAYLGFPPERVNQFMTATFDYMLHATDPALGYVQDGNRLVQRFSWFSATDPNFNGNLFVSTSGTDPYDPPFVRTVIGDHFATYAAGMSAAPDLAVVSLAAAPLLASDAVSATLTAQVANLGHGQLPPHATVQFYDGDPATGGPPIGPPQPVTLAGCGAATTVSWTWQDVDLSRGLLRQIYVVVTAADDDQQDNNSRATWLALGQHNFFIPLLSRP